MEVEKRKIHLIQLADFLYGKGWIPILLKNKRPIYEPVHVSKENCLNLIYTQVNGNYSNDFNIGIKLGQESNIFAIAVKTDQEQNWRDIFKNQQIPFTFTYKIGKDTTVYLFQYISYVPCRKKINKLYFLGEYNQILAPDLIDENNEKVTCIINNKKPIQINDDLNKFILYS